MSSRCCAAGPTKTPHPLVARRGVDGEWETHSYGAVVEAADALGQALLNRGLGQDRPLLILSGNSIEHFLMAFGALTAGVPVIPTSVAYSLQSKDHARIKAITELVRPGAVFADDGARFGAALQALPGIPVVVATEPPAGAELLDDLLRTRPAEEPRAGSQCGDAGQRGQNLVHLRLHWNTQGSAQPSDALVQPAVDAPGWPFLARKGRCSSIGCPGATHSAATTT
jgi:acyl-CoA synthetase (AMP-forming)/AMP-acid ligase II